MEPWFDDVDDRPRDAAFFVESALDDLQCADVDLNRYEARRSVRIADAVALARRNPEVYVHHTTDKDAVDQAVRAAVFDIALRLRCSEEYVRGVLFTAEQAMAHLPLLWQQARDGFVSMYLVGRTVGALARVRADFGASEEELDLEREAMRLIDQAASEWALSCPPAAFARRLRTLVDRLDPVGAAERHGRKVRERRVVVHEDEDGMSWFMAYIPTIEAIAAKRRLTSAAKHLQKHPDECRTRDQIRADLCSEWLRGIGTDKAVKTKIFVTIPVELLAAELVGHGPIDPLTAKQLFLDAKAFRRVIIDPIRSVVVDMDRRSRRATQAQREWLILQHGTCARDGCNRLAQDADIDHKTPWASGGKTDINELRPLCPRDHVHRHLTRAIYRSRPDNSVQVITPTGHESKPTPHAPTTEPPF
ncbi:HNH endonuclease [Microbacterium profundi]|uniref:HNH endonuclease signature motif containing protein n=1 Tax=Microbacterium profundi TaxID=450380 RepID=UPI001F3BD89B|nr:HNH endonuclease signature motif containing protein [Microbacterium profundi]MCE7481284.1 HNH endonuclease [Microbacterium profundi]